MSIALATYDEFDDTGLGFLKKIKKLHKKLGGKLERKIAKKLPKPLRKIEEKRFKLEDKIMDNKVLNKIATVVAVVVAAYFAAPAMGALLKTYGPTLAKAAASQAVKLGAQKYQQKKIAKAQKKAAAAEEAALQKQVERLEQEQAHAEEMQGKGYVRVQQNDGKIVWMPDPRSDAAKQTLLPVRTASGEVEYMPEEEAKTATEGTFFQKYKTPLLIGGGVVGLGLVAVLLGGRKK